MRNKGEHKGGGIQPTPYTHLATNQTIIPYPKPLKHSNKTKLRFLKSPINFPPPPPLKFFQRGGGYGEGLKKKIIHKN